MFELIKEKADIAEVLSSEMKLEFIRVGDTNLEFEDKTCPFCGHRDCFRIKPDGSNSFYHCFSCEAHGDVIRFISEIRKITPYNAALAIAKEYKIDIPPSYSAIQEIFELAANYYHNLLMTDEKVYAELAGKTPLQYQQEVRKHKLETIEKFQLGWSDGGLVTFLEALGFEPEILEQTGLVGKKRTDFLPNKAFVYPHRVNGRVSHFTFKDPLKVKEYQLKNSHKLNGHALYNQDSHKQDTVAIVEGENDLLSLAESNWPGGVLATIGQLSSSQLDWLAENLKGKRVVTFFDTDAAGDKYRDKLAKLKLNFGSLTQIKLTNGVKDIDEYLTNGGSLDAALKLNAKVVDNLGLSSPESASGVSEAISGDEYNEGPSDDLSIVEREGCYYKIRVNKDGVSSFSKLTNFTIQLRNVFVREHEREREIIIVREDGTRSEPTMVDSESKVSLKSFKVLVSNAVDGSFYGSENDLTELWEYVYHHSKNQEKIVYVPSYVGRMTEFGGGWLFRNMFITNTGAVLKPDSDGIIWFDNRTSGVRPDPIDGEKGSTCIPALNDTVSKEDSKALLGLFLRELGTNLGDQCLAISLVAWAKSCVYSNELFEAVQGFPFQFIWGRHGQGKTVIGRWLASLFDMSESGYMTVSQLKSGVGWGRKMAYYSSLPLMMDEIRADKVAAEQLYPNVRSWYQRASRALGTKEKGKIITLPVRSTTIFLGQDEFSDPATKQRVIMSRIPLKGREKQNTYKAIMTRLDELSSIGYHWILESTQVNKKELLAEWREIDKKLVEAGCEARSAKNWAVVCLFGNQLAAEYFPDLKFEETLIREARLDSQTQVQDDTIYKFFSDLEGLCVQDRSGITSDHLKREGNKLYVWFREVFNLVRNSQRSNNSTEEKFTETAVRNCFKDETWVIEESAREPMGISETRRRVVVIDLTKAPEMIQNIANTL